MNEAGQIVNRPAWLAEAGAVVEFWIGEAESGPDAAEAQRPRWYQASAELDDAIRQRFGTQVARAVAGGLAEWQTDATGALALVILLDQFTRNLYRGTPAAWCGDARAMQVAEAAIAAGLHRQLSPPGRLFLYHPHHHAETLAGQDRGVALLEEMLTDDTPAHWHDWVRRRVDGFSRHRDIVARFGRFPHRNAVLGRPSSAAEQAFLAEDPNSYGQAASGAGTAAGRA